MDRIRELETEKRAAKRTLYNTNKREKRLRKKVATMKEVLAEHLEANDELKEKLSKFEGKTAKMCLNLLTTTGNHSFIDNIL